MIGRSLGRYRITGRLGEGGMASVWKAEDTLLGRLVAVKVLDPALAQTPEARRRFRHEAEVASLLDHPAIAPVLDHGENDGVTWIAMTLVDGITLAERMTRGLLPVHEAVRIASVVGSGLGYAHARGVLHRDVTPRNILLAHDGRVVLVDFGLARVEGFSRVTRSGSTLGTLAYMAPESVMGGATADARSDLYGLGVVLYEMLTGSLPQPYDAPEALIHAKLDGTPRPPRSLRPEVPPALEAVVLRTLARQPAERFADADALLAALHDAMHAGEGAAEPPAEHPRPASEVLASDGATVHLGVPRFEPPAGPDPELADLCDALADALRRRLGSARRLHVVEADGPLAEHGDARAWARAHGARLILLGRARRAGTRVRVECTLVDPEAGVLLGGEAVDGSLLQPFDLEDRLVQAARALFPAREPALEEPGTAARAEPAPEDRLAQALRYLQRHDHEPSIDAAIGLLERLIAAPGEDASVCAALGRAYLAKYGLTKQHAWESRAAALVDRAARQAPDHPAVLLALAEVKALAGHGEEALALYQRVLAAVPDSFEAWHGLALLHERHGRFDEAESACRRAIAARPRDWRGYSRLGCVFHARGMHAEAIGPWRRVLRLSPDNARAAMNLGASYYHLDRFEEALTAFRRSIEIEPTAVGYTNLGTTLYTLHRFDEAVAMFERATRLRPADARLWGNLASACQYSPGHEARADEAHDRAIGLMREQLERDPDDAEGWSVLSGWMQARGRASEAEAALARALAIAPADVRVLVQAGHFRLRCGDPEGAVRWLREAVERGYGRGALARSVELKPLRGHPGFEAIIHPEDRPPRESHSAAV